LVDHAVGGSAGVAEGTTAGFGDGVEFVEEEDAGGGCSGFIENFSDVGFRLGKKKKKIFKIFIE
jgi:hypothetical protein